ncbi:hypothetical protein C2S51_017102 [Perilla frutescens var. frutescens]|nr:hypothetical protein C2S51_017102 [Perilla frutescens var. frutescens]
MYLMNSPVADSESVDDCSDTSIVISPGLTQYYVPRCDSSVKPVVGMMLNNILDGIEFYRRYAARCGFDVRNSTVIRSKDGTITWKYILCNRAGEKNTAVDRDANVDGVMDKRRRVSRRVRCRARIVLKFSGCTKTDVKNFTRNLRAYIVGADAQMVIDNLFKRREVCSAFYFEYLVDGEDKLKHIFWADPICRRNFAAFGNSVSFDATYNTNRYKMVFTPFTGKDNHGKCVTFGAALLSIPSLQTPILFEKHAAAVYTTNIFVKVQKEIYSACFKCRIMSITKNEPQLFYDVNDGDEIFQVVYDSVEEIVVCSCSKFVREGLLCCHIYILLKDLNVDRIPDKYVVRRWTRSCFDSVNGCLTDLVSSCVAADENKMKINTCISEFYACIGVVDGDDEKLSALLRCVRDFKEFLKHETSEQGIESEKNRIFYNFYGSSCPTQVDVFPPDVVKTKGSGSRLIPRAEKATREKQKPLRTCKKCNKMCRHDSRNCGKVKD